MHILLFDTERTAERRRAREPELAEHPLRQARPQAVTFDTGADETTRAVRELAPSVLAGLGEVSGDDNDVLGEEAELGLEYEQYSIEVCTRTDAPGCRRVSGGLQ
jgi:hypothetical protein